MRALFLLCAVALCSCEGNRRGDVQVTDIWAQPVDGTGTTAAVYMTITDKCTRPETLQLVQATLPQQASLHTSSVVDNALKMTPLPSVSIACDKPTLLKPMSMHVMVTGLRKAMEIGDHIPLTLRFDRSGDVKVAAEVTTLAVLENVDPMHMHMSSGHSGMQGMHMH